MYTSSDYTIEDICYEANHIETVLKEIKKNFDAYFDEFLITEAGAAVSNVDFGELKKKFGVQSSLKISKNNLTKNYKTIIIESIDDFEKDRQKYLDIMDEELLEEYEDDPSTFKSKILRNECPIIHSTLYNKRAKELDKYRGQFSVADPNEMLTVVQNLCAYANEYIEAYDSDFYESTEDYTELDMEVLDTDDYTVYGVIGGGIKSHILFKVSPAIFPNRSRSAIWALWYLSGKKTFGCNMDSEFLMIDTNKNTIQQNYFYPYDLFAYYALEVYKMLRDKATELGAYIDTDYRYVLVDAFFSFVADKHDSEISFFKSQIRDGGRGLA